MTNKKFVRVKTEDELPEYGNVIIITPEEQVLLVAWNRWGTEEFFRKQAKYWLKEIEDVSVNMAELLQEANKTIEADIQSMEEFKKKIEAYQAELIKNQDYENR